MLDLASYVLASQQKELKELKKEVSPEKFYVFVENSGEGIVQLSIGLKTYEQAVWYKETDYHKKKNPGAFIMCSLNKNKQ